MPSGCRTAMMSTAPPVEGNTVDTAATDPAPTPTAACATVEDTSRRPERTVSIATASARRRAECARDDVPRNIFIPRVVDPRSFSREPSAVNDRRWGETRLRRRDIRVGRFGRPDPPHRRQIASRRGSRFAFAFRVESPRSVLRHARRRGRPPRARGRRVTRVLELAEELLGLRRELEAAMRSGLFDIAAARLPTLVSRVTHAVRPEHARANPRGDARGTRPGNPTRRNPQARLHHRPRGPTAPTRRRRRRRRKQTPRRSAKANERVARRRAGRRNATKRNRESRNGANGDRLGARLGVVGDDEDARRRRRCVGSGRVRRRSFGAQSRASGRASSSRREWRRCHRRYAP